MSDPYIAEIRIFGCNFPPNGWAQCNGQLLPIAQYTALFSLLGTTYGGNGQSNFGLPNLKGRAVVDGGQGPGLTNYDIGEIGGQSNVTLLQTQMPSHVHLPTASPNDGTSASPSGNGFAVPSADRDLQAYTNNASLPVPMAANMLSQTGGNQPHNNLMPYLTLNICIALVGIYPS